MSFINKLLGTFQRALRQSVSSFIQLETSDNETTLVASDGSLISYIKIEGSRQIIGDEEYNKIVESATLKIGARFDRLGHAMQVYFARDPGRIREELETLVRPSRVTAENLGLEVDDVLEERIQHLQRYLTHEESYFVLWTRPSVLSQSEFKRAGKEAKEEVKEWISAGYAQYPHAALKPLRTRHKSFVSSILSSLDELGVRGQLLEVHKALAAIRSNLFPDRANDKWRACLPGDPIPPRAPMSKVDMSDLLWPNLANQITAADAKVLSKSVVRIGNILWAGADMTLGPMDATGFPVLLNRLVEADIPFRISFLIEGGGVYATHFRTFIATIMGASNSGNKQIKYSL